MKKLTIILIIALFAAVSCTKEPSKGQLDPNAMISLKPDLSATQSVQTKAIWHLSNKEIVKQAWNLSFYNEEVATTNLARGFSQAQRDTINVRLLMWGTDIISQFGLYVTEFINGRDFVIRRNLAPINQNPIWDTIAYIPQSIIVAARSQIKAAYDAGDYTTVYALFDNAFKFRQITGAEWRALKAQGQN